MLYIRSKAVITVYLLHLQDKVHWLRMSSHLSIANVVNMLRILFQMYMNP